MTAPSSPCERSTTTRATPASSRTEMLLWSNFSVPGPAGRGGTGGQGEARAPRGRRDMAHEAVE